RVAEPRQVPGRGAGLAHDHSPALHVRGQETATRAGLHALQHGLLRKDREHPEAAGGLEGPEHVPIGLNSAQPDLARSRVPVETPAGAESGREGPAPGAIQSDDAHLAAYVPPFGVMNEGDLSSVGRESHPRDRAGGPEEGLRRTAVEVAKLEDSLRLR